MGKAMIPEDLHGTRAAFSRGCRCEKCRRFFERRRRYLMRMFDKEGKGELASRADDGRAVD